MPATDGNGFLHAVGGLGLPTTFGTGDGAISVTPEEGGLNLFVARYAPSATAQAATLTANRDSTPATAESEPALIAEMMALEDAKAMEPAAEEEAVPSGAYQFFLPLIR
ncbi:MAG: hypothetical protein R2932_43225 [Caldilineaceae bacterium]